MENKNSSNSIEIIISVLFIIIVVFGLTFSDLTNGFWRKIIGFILVVGFLIKIVFSFRNLEKDKKMITIIL